MKFINVLMLIVLGCGGPSDKEASESVKKIILNSSQSKLEYDVTPLLEQSVDVMREEDREKLRNLVESLQDEDNPVLFKCKLKKI